MHFCEQSFSALFLSSRFPDAPQRTRLCTGAKMRSEYESIADQDRDQPQARDQWFMRGRLIPGELAAVLRYRAHQQKMQARAARLAAALSAGLDTFSQAAGAASGWIPLGPAPLASDASGVGQQDYNWVSGRGPRRWQWIPRISPGTRSMPAEPTAGSGSQPTPDL